MDTRISTAVTAAVQAAVQSAANDPGVPLMSYVVPDVTARVVSELAPTIENLTNSEPIWQSRVMWGVVLSAIGATGALFGFTLDADMQGEILNTIMLWVTVAGLVSGPLLAAWGRLAGRKPLGS